MSKTTNIRQRKNGLWEGRYRLNGKQCAVYGQTKAEAKAKLAARMTEVEQGICIELSSSASSLTVKVILRLL